ncbi:MAG: cupin domain-containing protein [Planctomycetes bacterium]|nr:cupin domain-containing protein [Planctomycetota bacterium]
MPNAFVIELNDEPNYQRLIAGAPASCGMKSGRVWLAPGTECGQHSTEGHEEQLVFLAGRGIAHVGDQRLDIGVGKICYIPPHTPHNIFNTGTEPLVYIFCVAPAAVANETAQAGNKGVEQT